MSPFAPRPYITPRDDRFAPRGCNIPVIRAPQSPSALKAQDDPQEEYKWATNGLPADRPWVLSGLLYSASLEYILVHSRA